MTTRGYPLTGLLTSRSFAFVISAMACGTLGANASAQQVPTSVYPAQVEKRFDHTGTPVVTLPEAAPAELPRSAVPAGQAAIQPFTLNTVQLEGNTVYTQAELDALYGNMLSQNVGNAEAQAIAQAVTDHYRKNGYILSQAVVAGADARTGALRIRVIEGYIANVIIEGEVRQSDQRQLIESIAQAIKSERPLNIAKLERYLLLLDDIPGASARGVVRPSATTFGAADLVINMTHKLWEASLNTNNRGSEYIGPFQHTATLAANSLLKVYDRTFLRYVTTSPVDELQFVDFQHEQTLNEEGTRLQFAASYTHTEPSVRPALPEIEGRSYLLRAGAFQPVIRSRKENLTLRAAFDYRNSDTDFFGIRLNEDRLRVLRGGATYDFADSFDGVDLIDVEVSQGLNTMNATDTGVNRSRTDGEANFTKINLDISRIHALPNGFSLLTAATGQYAFHPLLAAEQFAVGGSNFGQAYDPAELAGDHGVAAKAELRYGYVVGEQYLDSLQLFGYYDIGQVWALHATDDNNSLASTGAGVRVNFTDWLSGSGEVGFPLTKQVAAEGDKDPRFFFSVTGRF